MRHVMGFAFFLLVNAVMFIRSAEISPRWKAYQSALLHGGFGELVNLGWARLRNSEIGSIRDTSQGLTQRCVPWGR